MSEQGISKGSSSSSDYVTLPQVGIIVRDIFVFVLRVFGFIRRSVARRRWLFLSMCVLGLGVGWLYHRLSPSYYQSQLIVYQNDLNGKAYNEIIRGLNTLLTSGSYESFSSELGVGEDVSRKVLYMEALTMNNEGLQKDTSSKRGQLFKIRVLMQDNGIADTLQRSILRYLNNNPYLSQVKESQRRAYLEKLVFIDQEQRRLDSLKQAYNGALSLMRLPSNSYNNALDPGDIYRYSFELANQKEGIDKWLDVESKGVLLVDGFKKTIHPQSLSLRIALGVGLLSGALLGLLLCLFLYGSQRLMGQQKV